MAIVGENFLVGLLLGLVIACVVAFLLFSRKSRLFQNIVQAYESDKKQLTDAASRTSSEMAILNERALQASQLRDELKQVRAMLDEKRNENSDLSTKVASLKVQNEKSAEFFNQRIADLAAVHQNMKEAFASVSKDALITNADMINSSFKQSIEHFFKVSEKDRLQSNENLASVMNPLKESLMAVDRKVGELETSRQGAYSGLKEQIEGLLKSQMNLQKETQNLSRSLAAPIIRGRWGEMQLKRVVELSGLSSYCDFVEQKSITDGDDVLRPDMIVTMPKNKKIVIDAKAPLEMFVDEQSVDEARDEERGQEMVASLKRHLLALKKKSYHSVLGDSPEFVVMFLPSEAFLHWALTADPMLLDYAAQNEIIIATPITLVALLKAIAFGFKQEAIANNIEEVRKLSQQLIDRVQKVSSHFEKLGKNLRQATEAYNQTLSSLDSRVLVTARKLAQIKSLANDSEDTLRKSLPLIDAIPREVTTKFLLDEENEQ